MDIRSMARSVYDPSRLNSGYRNEKRKLRENFTAAEAAQNALPGSIAERNNPNRFGSAAGRFDGNFQPEAPGLLHDPAYEEAELMELQQERMETQEASRLKRRKRPGVLNDDVDLFGGLFEGLGLRREV